jgi:Zn-dependent M16 (insulinase) family peptidase
MAGLEGVEKDKLMRLRDLILSTLKNLVIDGVPESLINSSLHQLEMVKEKYLVVDALWIAINAGMYECLYTP